MATRNDRADAHDVPEAPPIQSASHGHLVEFDEFIDAQLRKTRKHVRSVDVAGSLMLLAAGTLVYFLLAAMFDHWIIAGGLGFWGRALFLTVFVLAAASYLAVVVVPLVVRRINPLYAAHTIERSRPTLKNALVNFLFFRANPTGLSAVVYQAVEEQAATNLAQSPADAAVDRSKVIKIGYALAGIVLVCALYTLLSPKDLLKTVGRIAMPWAEISAPTRTAIVEIEPGTSQAFRGQQLTVAARVQGLRDDGRVTLYYTTADGQIVDRPIEMSLPADGYKYACQLPAGDASLQQNVTYRIEAGDAITSEFRIEVVAAPTIFVRAVEYKYPAYTGLLTQRVEQQGDIKGIEGTEVTLDAVANGDIQSAYIDFDCDGKPDQRMQADGEQAKATVRLTLKEDRETPQHGSYQLVFKNAAGQQNPQPVRHQIEVTRDIAPEIQFVAPQQDPIDLPVNSVLALEIVANDPDFALAMVKLSAMAGPKPVFDKILLGEARRGQFTANYRFEPSKLGLVAGDVVEYSAVAEDTKNPSPNRTETSKRQIRIVSPDARSDKRDQLASKDRAGEGQPPPDGEDTRGGDADKRPQDDQGQDGQQPPDPGKSSAGGTDEKQRPDNANQRQQPGKQDEQDKQQQGQGEQQGSDPQDESKEGAGKQGEGKQGQGDDAAKKSGQQGKSQGERKGDDEQPAAEPSVPNDGSNDGDAIEKILARRDEKQGQNNPQQKQQPQPGEQNDKPQNDGGHAKQPSGAAKQSGEQPQPQDKQDGKRSPRPEPSAPGGKESQGKQESGEDGGQPQGGQPQGQDSKEKGQGRQGDPSGSGQPSGDPQQKDGQGKQKSGDQAGNKSDSPSKSDNGSKSAQRQPDQSDGDAKAKQGDSADKSGDRRQSDGTKSGDKNARAADEQGGQPDNQPNADDDVRPADDRAPREKQPGAGKSDGKDASKQNARGDDAKESGAPDKGDSERQPTKGQGAKSQTDPTTGKNPQSKDAQRSEAKGGDGQQQKGESGAGQKSDDEQGSPSPKEAARPRDKSPRPSPGDEDPKDPEKGQAASKSDKESDSEVQDDGEHSGGGKRGGGQKANKPGTGGAGQNTAADEGAGTSNEAGQGETSDRAGRDREGDKPTGQSGEKSGQGSSKKPATGQQGQRGSEGSGESKSNALPDAAGKDSPRPGAPGGGEPTGGQGGTPNDSRPPDAPWKPGDEVADKANLDYARQATDLALAHLKDELSKSEPDPELLDRLGWTRSDLEKFVARWEQLRQAADAPGNPGQSARRELDETLRSLGLRPKSTTLRGQTSRDDRVRGMKESRRTTAPPEYAEQTKAYTQGTARGGK